MSLDYPAALVHRRIPALLRGERVADAARFLQSQTPPGVAPNDQPIFVLSAGWRSGSTLLQRLICSAEKTLLWGEPFGEYAPLHRMAASVELMGPDSPHLHYTCENLEKPLEESWIANLNPGIEPLRKAHHAYFDTLFRASAFERGFLRWGMKTVRVTGHHAHYLRWIYPKCKIVFLIRNPIDAYRSYKRKTYWYTVRPTFRIDGVTKFMAHWAYLTQSFLDHADELGALVVRYDQLTAENEAIASIAEYLECDVRADVLSEQIGSRKKSRFRVYPWERQICHFVTNRLRRRVGW